MLNPLPNDKFLDSLKLQDFSDDNFKINKGCGELSKRVENHVGKGKLVATSNFSFSHSVFENVLQTSKIKGLFGKGLTSF